MSPVRNSYFEFDVAFTRCTLLIRLCGWRCGVVAFVDARMVAAHIASTVVTCFYSRAIVLELCVVMPRSVYKIDTRFRWCDSVVLIFCAVRDGVVANILGPLPVDGVV